MGKEATRNRRFEKEKTERWLKYAGDFPIATAFLSTKTYNSGWFVLKFVNALLRSYGHIVFVNNPFSGLLIAIALFWANPPVALIGLYSAAIGLIVSILLKISTLEAIDNGSTIFNNVLFGLVSGGILPAHFGIPFESRHWFYVTIGAILCVFVTSALTSLLGSVGNLRLLSFALPFNVVQFIFFVCVVRLDPVGVKAVISLEGQNLTYTVGLPTHVSHPHMNRMLFQEGDLMTNRSQEIVRATEKMAFHTPVANGSRNLLQSLPLRQGNEKVELMIDTPTTISGEDVYGTTEVFYDNVRIGNSELDVELDLNRSWPNVELGIEGSTHPSKIVSDVETYTNRREEEIDSNMQTESNFVDVSGFDVEESYTSRTAIDISSGWNNNTYPNITRKRRNATKETNDNEILLDFNEDKSLDWGQVFAGIILSMTQAYGFCHVQASLMMYLGVLICSPITGAFCLTGAVLGTLTGIVMSEAPYTDVYSGVWGFNGLLSAGALGGFCFVVTWQSTLTTLACVVFTTVLQRCLMLAFEEANMPVLSLPFNLSAILFLCVTSADARRLPRPDALSFPEKHLYMFHHQENEDMLEEVEQDEVSPTSSAINEKSKEVKEKRAPLAVQEVV